MPLGWPSSALSFIILNLWPPKWGPEGRRELKAHAGRFKDPGLAVTYIPSAHMPVEGLSLGLKLLSRKAGAAEVSL